jgi:ABC-2 type transport system permease protein
MTAISAPLSNLPTAALVRPPLTGPAGVPFARLLRTELRKLTDTRAGKWLMTVIIAATPIIVLVDLFTAKTQSLTYSNIVDLTQTPQEFLLPALGLLAVTTEWSQRTGLVTFTLAPHRGRVLRAKAAATGVLGLLAIAVAFVTAAIGNLLGSSLRHGDGSWAFGFGGFRDLIVVQLGTLAEGFAFGMLLLVSSAAIITYYVLPTLASFAVNTIPGLKADSPWFDLISAQSPLYNHTMTGTAWLQWVVSFSIWVVLPGVFGVLRVLRSEIKSS